MNRITKLLNIEYPLILGGMAWIGTARLAAAVSEAGGLGTIGSGGMTPDILTKELDKIKELTDKPFAVNLMLLNPYIDELVDVCLKKGVKIYIFGAGNPSKYLEGIKAHRGKVLAVVASETLALRLEREGIDAVIGEGMECGGHIGSLTTMTLVPKLAKTVGIPVVAAGGIALPEQVAASFVLGAEGVQIGTRFIASDECEAHEIYKEKVIKGRIRDTVITGGKLGHPARSIKTKFTRKLGMIENESPEEAERLLVGSLKKAFLYGSEEEGVFMAGQSIGLIDEIKSVREIVEELFPNGYNNIEKNKKEEVAG
ncbi:MAG TPA: nitronate monooxygenase [Thermotogota bacterium]|nr:nitronate monooxygenase [Thermotogota bacterium]HPJ89292.1 nitronate monooxygenase [Thermotogota bacterium]HPR95163.1 nitronate monooxygenase [Thermotogota bacterium]